MESTNACEVANTIANELPDETNASWREIDRRLGTLARQRCALDAEEARWLRAAARCRIWQQVGCASLLDYLERRLGYGPRAAQDRVRVAFALEELPALADELERGMPYTAVRELSRVATRDTEHDWIAACRGKNVHEIERAVAGHRPGSRPSDPGEPELAGRRLPLEDIRPATQAAWREARHKLQAARGTHVSDDELLAALCGVYLEGAKTPDDDVNAGRAKYQVAVTVCDRCQQGWRDGAGRTFPLDAADTERALCDAQHLGALDGEPARATQDIAPRVRRFVVRRDRGTCRVPGCRSAANLELHHIVPRSRGGSHQASNLIQLCDGCHTAHHRDLIDIAGTSDKLVVTRRHELGPVELDPTRAHVDASTLDHAHVGTGTLDRAHVGAGTLDRTDAGAGTLDRTDVGAGTLDRTDAGAGTIDRTGAGAGIIDRTDAGAGIIDRTHVGARHRQGVFDRVAARTQALDALVTLGFKRHEARSYVDGAIAELGHRATDLEALLRAALQRVPHR